MEGNTMKKKLFKLTALACVMAVGLTTAVACGGSAPAKADSLVTVDINPSIELTLDRNNIVLSAYGANEDGQILLYEETGIVGTNVEFAVDKITELAKDYGYLTEDNTVVNTTVTSTDQNKALKIKDKIDAKITAKSDKFGFDIQIAGENLYSLSRKFEQFLADHPDCNVTINEFKLALSAAETGEVTLEAAIEMDASELLEIISDNHKKVKKFFNDKFEDVKVEAQKVYEELEGSLLDAIYMNYYLTHILENTDTFAYGVEYYAYKSIARALNVFADQLARVEKAVQVPLNQEQIATVMLALGIEDATLIQNTNGQVTINSIEEYANGLFKNAIDDATLDQIEDNLDDALEVIEDKFNAEIDLDIDDIVEEIQDVLEGVIDAIPSVAKQFFTEFEELVAEVESILADATINAYELRDLGAKFEKKANEVLTKINLDLDANAKAQIKAMQDAVKETLAKAKDKMNETIANAEKEAKAHFDKMKEDVRNRHHGK